MKFTINHNTVTILCCDKPSTNDDVTDNSTESNRAKCFPLFLRIKIKRKNDDERKQE